MTGSAHIKKTLRHAVVYSSATILGKLVGFVMLPVYAHYLRGEGYGIIGMIDVVLSMLTVVVGYGISGAMGRFYFEKETEPERHQLVSTSIFLMFVLVVAVSSPLLVFPDTVGRLAFGHSGYGYYIVLAVVAFMGEMTAKNPEAYLLLEQKPFFYSIIALVKLVLSLFLNILFIVHMQLGVEGYLLASLICGILYSLFMHVWAFRRVGFGYNPVFAREIIRFCLPLVPGYVAMFLRGNVDRVLLRTFLGLTQLGAFEMLFKFATIIGVVVVEPFSKIWNVKRYEICDQPEGPETISRVFTLQMAIMLLAALILALEIPLLLRVLTPSEFWLSGEIALLAVLSRVLNAAYYHLFFGLIYAKKTFKISIIQGSSAAVSIGLNFLLISRYGILGAVIASCMVNLYQCLLAFVLAKGYYRIPFQWLKVVQMTAIAMVLFWLIDPFSVLKIGLGPWIEHGGAEFVTGLMHTLHLDAVKGGKLMSYVVNNIGIVIDGQVKIVLALMFVPVLFLLNILPRELFFKFFKFETLKNPLRAMSGR